MKETSRYMQDLKDLKEFFGFDLSECEQGTNEWLHVRRGVISASNAWRIIKKGRGKDGYSVEREKYKRELVAEIITKESKELHGRALDWGKHHELGARTSYEFVNNVVIEEIPFIFKDDFHMSNIELPKLRCGCSLDGRLQNEDVVLEIKCPFDNLVFMAFVLDGKVKPEYQVQMNYQMWCTGAKRAIFANYNPRFVGNMFASIEVERDEEVMDALDIEIPKFVLEIDEMLSMFGAKFGDQWK